MAGLGRPHGPLPARVYWVRRVLVLSSALLLVVGLGMLLTNGSDGSDRASGDTAVRADAEATTHRTGGAETTSAAPTEPVTTGPAKKQRKQKKRKKAVPLAAPDGECEASDVRVEPTVNRAVAGRDIAIWLVVESTGREACTWQLDEDSLALKITSGKDDIWFGTECPRALPAEDLVVRAAKAQRVRFDWDARRSDSGCTDQRPWVLDGYYHVEAAAMGGEPTDTQFEVVLPTPKTVTPSPSPSTKDTKKSGAKKKREAGR